MAPSVLPKLKPVGLSPDPKLNPFVAEAVELSVAPNEKPVFVAVGPLPVPNENPVFGLSAALLLPKLKPVLSVVAASGLETGSVEAAGPLPKVNPALVSDDFVSEDLLAPNLKVVTAGASFFSAEVAGFLASDVAEVDPNEKLEELPNFTGSTLVAGLVPNTAPAHGK